MFVIGIILFPNKPSFAGIPTSTECQPVTYSFHNALRGIVAIVNPSQHKEWEFAQTTPVSFVVVREWGHAGKNERPRFADVKLTRDNVIWGFSFVRRFHRQPHLATIDLQMRFYDSGAHSPRILNETSAVQMDSRKEGPRYSSVSDYYVSYNQPRAMLFYDLESGNLFMFLKDISLNTDENSLLFSDFPKLLSFRNLPFGGVTEAVSGDPQGESESGDDDRRKCGKKSVVAVNEAQGANKLSFEEPGDDLAIFIGTVGALLVRILSYTGLKRGCDFIFGPDKYGER